MGIEIVSLTREYAEKNADEILKLDVNWTEIGDKAWDINDLFKELPNKWDLSHVALYDGNHVGYQIGCLCETEGHLGKVYLKKILVDRSIRNMGIGKGLITNFLEKSDYMGIERVRFRVRTDNPAVSFYDKYKFNKEDGIDRTRIDGVESYFYDTPISEVLKRLKNAHQTV